MECPICMDDLHTNKNFISTECGHCFHASCLMANVAHNGFGCPYCRTTMTEKGNRVRFVEDDEETILSENSDDDRVVSDDVAFEEFEYGDDYEHRGLRFFMNNLENTQHDVEDIKEEKKVERYWNILNRDGFIYIDSEDLYGKLVEKGLTMKDIVKMIELNDDPFQRLMDIISH